MTLTEILIQSLIWLLICYLWAGVMFSIGGLFEKEKQPFYMYFLIIIFWSYSLYHYWRDRR